MEFINGIMITAASLITMSGIILAVGCNHVFFDKKPRMVIILSMTMGAGALFFGMVWFDNPTDSKKLVALLAVAAQFFILYYPLSKLIKVMERD